MAEIVAATSKPKRNENVYHPVQHHWFHRQESEGVVTWIAFSRKDSSALETSFTSVNLNEDTVVSTDGGRFDVNILRRRRIPVYWSGEPTEVRRCSWSYAGQNDVTFIPFEEEVAQKLEQEYELAFVSNRWNRKVQLVSGDTVIFHAPDMLVLSQTPKPLEAWPSSSNQIRARMVKRGVDGMELEDDESDTIDHLLFLVHGIGSVCDLRFRSVEQVVDDFRSTSLRLVQSHYRSSYDKGAVHRVEVLPISWHKALHSEETGIDKKLKSITLESVPYIRDVTNDTLLDILFYTSPVYCQTIISAVGNQLNHVYKLFKQRNPTFNGGVSLGGHSLGSLILFDILYHQHPEPEPAPEPESESEPKSPEENNAMASSSYKQPPKFLRQMSGRIIYVTSNVEDGQPQLFYPLLDFKPTALFALGSPIGMFVTVRGIDTLGPTFVLPTCPGFFNIFHPYDPVAYRIEPLINPELVKLKPVLIPHHKGRKRMHLELKETMAKVGADLKQRFVDSFNSFFQLALFNRRNQSIDDKNNRDDQSITEGENSGCDNGKSPQIDKSYGSLNKNRRIDYVLQEAPHEIFNEYLASISSHVCYWVSEDTTLLILNEIYNSMDISPDDKIPQQTMKVERGSTSNVQQNAENVQVKMD